MKRICAVVECIVVVCTHVTYVWCILYRKKPVREDYCTYLTPATHLLALRREKAEVEQALIKQKEVRHQHVSRQ